MSGYPAGYIEQLARPFKLRSSSREQRKHSRSSERDDETLARAEDAQPSRTGASPAASER
jgi:hypothetical protein